MESPQLPAPGDRMADVRRWAAVTAASIAGLAVIFVAPVALGLTGGPFCPAHQKSDIATMKRVIAPLLLEADRPSMWSNPGDTGCDSGDPADVSWTSTRPAQETLTNLQKAGWTRMTNPEASYVTDGYFTTVGTKYITVLYFAEDSTFQAELGKP
jgi:hypothetical protein